MAQPLKVMTVECPRCGRGLQVPLTWTLRSVHRPGEARVTATPDMSIVKTHLMLHLPQGPDDGLPIAS